MITIVFSTDYTHQRWAQMLNRNLSIYDMLCQRLLNAGVDPARIPPRSATTAAAIRGLQQLDAQRAMQEAIAIDYIIPSRILSPPGPSHA